MLLAEEMKRVVRFWEADARKWENRAAHYSPERAAAVPISTIDSNYPLIVKRLVNDQLVLYAGKRAYAFRQVAVRRALLGAAKSMFSPMLKLLETEDGKKASSLVEMG